MGLEPDVKCVPDQTEATVWFRGQQSGASYATDPCIQVAKRLLQASQ